MKHDLTVLVRVETGGRGGILGVACRPSAKSSTTRNTITVAGSGAFALIVRM